MQEKGKKDKNFQTLLPGFSMPTAYGLLVNKSHQPVWNCWFADMIRREGVSLWPLALPLYSFPACLLHGLPFANFFFCLLCRQIHSSHAWENLNVKMHMRLIRKRRQIHLVFSLFIPKHSFISVGGSCYLCGAG